MIKPFLIFRYFLMLTTALMLLTTPACKKCKDPTNPDCDNYDPCFGSSEVSADFTIHEVTDGSHIDNCTPPVIESSIVNDLSFVKFTSKQDLDEYYWIVGSETIKSKSFSRMGFPRGKHTPITLIGYRTPNNRCYPNDDGWDTITKFIYCLEMNNDFKEPIYTSLCYGWFNGYNISDKTDTFTMTYWFYDAQLQGFSMIITTDYFINIPFKGARSDISTAPRSAPFRGTTGANAICIQPRGAPDSTGFLHIEGIMYTLDSGHSITFDYKYTTRIKGELKYNFNTFIGKRIK